MAPIPIVVLISGEGTNLQAIIDAAANDGLPVEIRAVISNRPGANGLNRARRAGIPCQVVDHKAYPDRTRFESALMNAIDAHHPALVVLAGFMRILGAEFVDHYRGRLLNIHPSLLPEFPGLETHRQALEAGAAEHGASVHFVTDEVDGGPVVIQARVPVRRNDDAQSLAERVREQEHRIFVLAIRWFAEGRLKLHGDTVLLDGQSLNEPLEIDQAKQVASTHAGH